MVRPRCRRVFTKIQGKPKKNHRGYDERTHNYQNWRKNKLKVEVGQAVYVEKLNVEAGQEVTFNEVVLYWW